MQRRTLLLFFAFCLLGAAIGQSQAADTFLLGQEAATAPVSTQARLRELGSLSLWILPAGQPLEPELAGTTTRLELAEREHLYAVERAHADLSRLGPHTRVLALDADYALLAIDEREAAELDPLGGCVERLRWTAPAAVAPRREFNTEPSLKQSLVEGVDPARYGLILAELSGGAPANVGGNLVTIDNRYTYAKNPSRKLDEAILYLGEQFENAGYAVTHQPFTASTTPVENLIAIKTGTQFPDEVVVIGAHYDSRSESDAVSMTIAPGAEDNASGTAVVVHLAEVLAEVETARSVHFVCFGAEEQGLLGSREYVDRLSANGWSVAGAFTMDMVAAWQTRYGVLIEGRSVLSEALMQSLNSNALAFTSMSTDFSYNPFGSDHMPFIDAGIPALLAIDLDWAAYPHYHRQSDTTPNTDADLGADIARAVLGAVIDLAGPVTQVRIGANDGGTPHERRFELHLGQNHPNPFNPLTSIRYEVPRDGNATLRILDMRGREVRRLASGTHASGPHTVTWNGTDHEGRPVASGLYFYRLEHEDGWITRRMALLR